MPDVTPVRVTANPRLPNRPVGELLDHLPELHLDTGLPMTLSARQPYTERGRLHIADTVSYDTGQDVVTMSPVLAEPDGTPVTYIYALVELTHPGNYRAEVQFFGTDFTMHLFAPGTGDTHTVKDEAGTVTVEWTSPGSETVDVHCFGSTGPLPAVGFFRSLTVSKL